jgi:hypothetical protein
MKILLNSIITKNPQAEHNDISLPYVIVMVVEMQLYFLYLKNKKLYITKKFKTILFPATLDNFPKAAENLLNGLYNLLVHYQMNKKTQKCH